jgi:hypothetical protein
MKVRSPHPRRTLVKVDRHAAAVILVSGTMALAAFVIGPKRDRPEQAAGIGMDAWVEVVNLGGEVLEVEPTPVKIQSNESERPPVNGAILADVDALHKAHISIEEERLDTAVRPPGGSLSSHVCDADNTFEIGDRGRVHPLPEEGEVEIDPVDSDRVSRRLGSTARKRCRRSGGRPCQHAAQRGSGSGGRRAADEGAA